MTYSLGDVFNEAGLPDVTYVSPAEAQQLKGSLATKGKHVTLVGPSGSGKSTVALRVIRDLGLVNKIHMFNGRTYSASQSIMEILASEFECSHMPEEIEEWLAVHELVVIDDVHHLSLSARRELAANLKLWHENGYRFFMIGIAKTTDEILGQDPELAIRNDSWHLGAQQPDFMRQLMAKGEAALHVKFPDEHAATAVAAAQGSPSIFQAICRIACVAADVFDEQTAIVTVPIDLTMIRDLVVRRYDGRYLSKTVNLARGRRQARSVHDTYFRLVEYVASSKKQQLSRDELYHQLVGSDDARKKSALRTSFYRALESLPKVIEEHGLNDILIYENQTLSIDDPVYRFYLDHLDFSRVRSQVNIRRVGYEYDVAVSFAGPDRPIVEALVQALKGSGLEVFYDFDQQALLWGRDLRTELAKVYSQDALFMIVCLSAHYPERDWPTFELEVGKDAASKRTEDYLLPVIVGDERPAIVGLPATIGHLTLSSESLEFIVEVMHEKIQLLPPVPVVPVGSAASTIIDQS